MRSSSRADLGYRALGLLPVGAAATAEGAWVAIVYAAIGLRLHRGAPEIGLWTFVVAAVVGIVVARRVRGRASGPVRAGAIVLASLIGWMSDPMVRDLLGGGAYGQAMAQQAGGWLLGLAAFRGTRHADPVNDDTVTGSLLVWAVPGLALPWLIGTASDTKAAFVSVALPATLLFVAACLVAVGVTRLDTLGRTVGLDWRRNRTWLALLVGIVGSIVIIGTPVAFLLGTSVEAIVGTILGPIGSLLSGAAAVLGSVTGSGTSSTAPTEATSERSPGLGPLIVGLPDHVAAMLVLAIGFALVAGGVLLWRLVREATPEAMVEPPHEQRKVNLPKISIRFGTLRLPRLVMLRRSAPRSASGAYLAVLRALEHDARSARLPGESPAMHARRLREAGQGYFSFDLLAADFELERYAGSELTTAETHRAIRRWRDGVRSPGRGRHPDDS